MVKTHIYEDLEKVILLLRKTIRDGKQGIALISANYGTGKTLAAKELEKVNHDVFYMKIYQTLDTPSKFTRELARILGSAISRSYQETLDFLRTYLEATNQSPIVILDEAQRLLRKRSLIGEIKDIFEDFPIRFILLGDLSLQKEITKYTALNKRVIIRKILEPITQKTITELGKLYNIKTDETLLKLAQKRGWTTIEVDRFLYYAKAAKISNVSEIPKDKIKKLIEQVEISLKI
ncbi:MAG: ATP-binding protein [Aquificae bacterium]|nr:ATP-binding protein [Aquificota bacterium]